MEMLNNIFYMYSNMDNSSQILIFLIVLVILMLLSIFIINMITKKRNAKYNMQFNPSYKYKKIENKKAPKIQEKVEVKPIKHEEPVKVEEIKEEEPEVIEIVTDNNSIDKISQLLEDNLNTMDPIDLTGFEEDQEKNAIISYDELVRRAGAKKIVYKTEEKPIKKEVKNEKIETIEENKGKFKASQIISPIYGIKKEEPKKENLEEFIDISNVPITNSAKKDDEMDQDIEFLSNLKTFRRNLD